MHHVIDDFSPLAFGFSTLHYFIAPPSLSHTDGSSGYRRVIIRNGSSQATLTVNMSGGVPPVSRDEIYWSRSRNDSRISDENSTKYELSFADQLSQFNLTIMLTTFEDSGIYTTTVNHEAATVSIIVIL